MVRRTDADSLRIAGLTPFSTVDWPDTLAATLFLQGCPWDCFYCHNPALIDPRAAGTVTWAEVRELLAERTGLLDAVVFSGGEPTMQPALRAGMREVREAGFRVGLHTGGAFPTLLAGALAEADWVGLDIKASLAGYTEVTARAQRGQAAWRSLELVLAAVAARADTERPLDYEVRTTVHPAAIDDAGLEELGCALADAGVCHWAVQRFRDTGTRSPLPRVAPDTAAPLTLAHLPHERFASLTIR